MKKSKVVNKMQKEYTSLRLLKKTKQLLEAIKQSGEYKGMDAVINSMIATRRKK